MRRHALLIAACPRSGATALAGALACAGAHAGRSFVAAPSGEPAETWQSATLAPGTYVARAVLKSQNYPVQQEKRFTVQGTTVATR